MDKETLSHYGWIVILVLVLAVLLALASPLGMFVADGFKATYAGFDMVGTSAMDVVMNATGGCTHTETEVKNVTNDYTGDTICKKCEEVLEEGKHIVPEGGKYTDADNTVYNPGDEMPEKPRTGDTYEYHDYIYAYNAHSRCGQNGLPSWTIDENINGWGVNTKYEKGSYGYMLHEINGEPIVSLKNTFSYIDYDIKFPSDFTIPTTTRYAERMFMYADITELPSTFVLPEGITSMYEMFKSTPIKDLSNFVIPSTVTNLENTFQYCGMLKYAPDLPDTATNAYQTFYGCSSLLEAPEIPNKATDISRMFGSCSSITVLPSIPEGITIMTQTFSGCQSAKTYVGSTDPDGDFSGYHIPNTVTNLGHTFYGCRQMVIAPQIPSSIINIDSTFAYCTALTQVTIPNGVKSIQMTFQGCTSLVSVILPNTINDMFLTFDGCTSLKTVSPIPQGVSDMERTFQNCTSLEGDIFINYSGSKYNLHYENCFKGTVKNIVIIGNGSNNDVLEYLVSTATNNNVTIKTQ